MLPFWPGPSWLEDSGRVRLDADRIKCLWVDSPWIDPCLHVGMYFVFLFDCLSEIPHVDWERPPRPLESISPDGRAGTLPAYFSAGKSQKV